jgi:hypothetical protein
MLPVRNDKRVEQLPTGLRLRVIPRSSEPRACAGQRRIRSKGYQHGSDVPKVDISKSTPRSASRSSATKNWGNAFILDQALVI